MGQKIVNNARALLAASVATTDTSLTVQSADADTFPVGNTTDWTNPVDWFKATLQDSSGNIEIVHVGVRASGSAILSNLVRAQDGTSALNFTAGSVVELRLTAADVQDAIDGTFPTVTADKIINDTVVGRTIPVGGIVMWSGSILSIPAGWALCDGTNGTPNLRDKFIMGAGSAYSPGAQGGSADATLVAHTHTFSATTGTESADHTHTGYTDVQGAHAHNYTAPGASSLDDRNGSNSYPMDPVTRSTDTQGAHQHNVQTYGNSVAHTHNVAGTADSAGASPTGANLPPFFALAYIMALGY
jgi:hypothetical protein